MQWAMSSLLVAIGIGHFVDPAPFMAIMPPQLPAPKLLVFISGAAEISLGVALMIPRLTRLAAWGIIALLIAVYPANIYHAFFGGIDNPDLPELMRNQVAAIARLPLQFVFIAWAWMFTRKPA